MLRRELPNAKRMMCDMNPLSETVPTALFDVLSPVRTLPFNLHPLHRMNASQPSYWVRVSRLTQ